MSIFTLPQFKVKSAKNRWKIVFAVLIVVVVGIYVLSRYAKKNSYPTKPTIDKVEFVYTQPTPLPTIIPKIGDKLDYQNLQTDISGWKEYKKEVDGLLISFKYPKQYKIWELGLGAQSVDSSNIQSLSIVKTLPGGEALDNVLVDISRPILQDGVPYIRVDDNLSLIEGIRRNDSWLTTERATVLREIQTKNKKVVRIEYESGWLPGPAYGPSSQTYVILDNGYLFTFVNHNLIPLEEFIAILDSFKVEKCLKFCRSK